MEVSTRIALECRAILFDLDGVLIDSTAVVERVWSDFATQAGLDAEELVATVHGRRTEDTIREWLPDVNVEEATRTLERVEIELAGEVDAVPGAAELLAGLPGGLWGVVTAAGRELATARLRAAGLPIPPSEAILGAEDVSAGKPDPEPYLEGARRLAVSPAECLAIEDAPAGVLAARRAGMAVIGVLTTHTADQLSDATHLVRSMKQVSAREADLGLRVELQTVGDES